MPTVPTFAVRETDVSRHNGGTSGAPLKPLRDDSALRALSLMKVYISAKMLNMYQASFQKIQVSYIE